MSRLALKAIAKSSAARAYSSGDRGYTCLVPLSREMWSQTQLRLRGLHLFDKVWAKPITVQVDPFDRVECFGRV